MFKIDRKIEFIGADLPFGSEHLVPKYIVGSNQLLVFYDGLLCIKSTPDKENQYLEVGNIGEVSEKIELHFALEKDDELTSIVISFKDTDGCDKCQSR
jgi:hypothetical protein